MLLQIGGKKRKQKGRRNNVRRFLFLARWEERMLGSMNSSAKMIEN